MKINNFASALLTTALLVSSATFAQKSVSRIRPVIPFPEATLKAPAGMVYIPGGTTVIKYSQQATDSNSVKKVSLSSYFIDKTETTNQQYREFVEWVIDSIAIVHYLADEDKYFRDAKIIDTSSKNGDSTFKGYTNVRRIDWSRVKHSELFGNPENKMKLRALIDERGNIRKDSCIFSLTYLRANGTPGKHKMGQYVDMPVNVYPDEQIWAKDLTNAQTDILIENYFNTPPYDDYPVVGVNWIQARAFAYWRSVTYRGLSSMADYMKTYRLVYTLPSEAQWVYAAQQDMRAYSQMMANNAPQVAETDGGKSSKSDMKDAKESKAKKAKKGKKTDSTALVVEKPAAPAPAAAANPDDPTSAWTSTSSTSADMSSTIQTDSLGFFDINPDDKTLVPSDKKGLSANFKQDEGEYTGDGSPFTLPVMSYAPNDFGVYNMIGNVAEWTMDAFSPSTFAFVSDVNPILAYDADSSDSDPMKRKVVRGGSFMSSAKALSPYYRDFELQTTAHCFIGFRCVMAAPELLTNATATRRKSGKKSK